MQLIVKRFVRIFLVLSLIFAVLSLSAPSVAAVNLEGYTYASYGVAIKTPAPFSLSGIIEFESAGGIENAQDFDIDENGKMVLADTGNNRVLIFGADYELKKEIKDFAADGKAETFHSPQGVCIANRSIYVADTLNERVVVFDEDGNFERIIGAPKSDTLRDGFIYRPSRIAVNSAGYVYTVGTGMIEGIAEFNTSGEFVRFSACNESTPDLLEYFWTRTFATDKQKSISALFLSEEFNSLAIDEEGYFITVSTTAGIKRFNTKGSDITKTTGDFLLVGDYKTADTQNAVKLQDKDGNGVSKFVDIAVGQKGIYSVIDEVYQRIFTYDYEGNLLWAFGEQGSLKGSFNHVSAITYDRDGKLYALDSELNRVSVFTLTEFGRQVQEGCELRFEGDNDGAAFAWAQAAHFDATYPLAYFGKGMIEYNSGKYKEAMKEFKLADNRIYYSKSLVYYRRDLIGKYFPIGMAVLFVGISALVAVNAVRRKQGKIRVKPTYYSDSSDLSFIRQLKYSKYVVLHPFKAFYDMKQEKKASVLSATVLLLLLVAMNTVKSASTAYLFDTSEFGSLSLFKEFQTVFVIALVFCAANWALTTLMDGEGSFKQIYIMTSYAVTPLTVSQFLTWGLGHFLSLNEASFLSLISTIGIVLSVFLLFIGTIVTHQYTLTKNFGAWILTAVAIMAMLFLAMIGVQMMDWVVTFIKTFGKEIISTLD